MIGSEYIRWAKASERFRYSIGRSSIRPCPPERLDARSEDFAISGPNAHGWPPLMEALAERYRVEPRQIVLTIGCSMANHLACAALIGRGGHVVVDNPGYEPLRRLPELFGAEVSTYGRSESEGWRLNVDRVAAALRPSTRLVVISNPHNPTGVMTPARDLDALAQLAEEAGFHVLVDEVYLEFGFQAGEPIAARMSPRFVSTCSLTKAYGLDGLRAGWLVAAAEVAERVRALNDLYGIIMPHPTERLAWRALQRVEALQSDVASLLEGNRRAVEAFIASRPELSWVPPARGPVGLVRLQGDVDALAEILEQRHDATLTPGHFFGAPDHFRIGFGMTRPDLDAGLERLESALETLSERSR